MRKKVAASKDTSKARSARALAVAHDALSLSADASTTRDAQTLILLVRAALDGDPTARALAAATAKTVRSGLSRDLEAGGEQFTWSTEAESTASEHAELVAASVAWLNEGPSALPDAGFLLDALRWIKVSPISVLIERRWGAGTPRADDVARLVERLARDVFRGRRVDAQRAVHLALATVGYPKPSNVWAKRDMKITRG